MNQSVESMTTMVMKSEINFLDLQRLLVGGATLIVITFQILVNKLSDLIVNLTLGKMKFNIYSGPIVYEQFRVKNFQGSVKIPSFQCIIVGYVKSGWEPFQMSYDTIRRPVDTIKLEIDKDHLASFPNTKCSHVCGIYCAIKVSHCWSCYLNTFSTTLSIFLSVINESILRYQSIKGF